MYKYIGALLLVVGLIAGLLVVNSIGASASTQTTTNNAVVTFSNIAWDAGLVDVYIDHNLVVKDISSKDPSVNIQVTRGNHMVEVISTRENIVVINPTQLTFDADHSYQLTLKGLRHNGTVALVLADMANK